MAYLPKQTAATNYDKKIHHSSAFYPPGFSHKAADLAVAHWATNGKGDAHGWHAHTRQAVVHMLNTSLPEQQAMDFVGATSPPEVVQVGARFRPFTDGGGLISPGRWAPHKRGPIKLPGAREEIMKRVLDMKLPDMLRAGALRLFKECTVEKPCHRLPTTEFQARANHSEGLISRSN